MCRVRVSINIIIIVHITYIICALRQLIQYQYGELRTCFFPSPPSRHRWLCGVRHNCKTNGMFTYCVVYLSQCSTYPFVSIIYCVLFSYDVYFFLHYHPRNQTGHGTTGDEAVRDAQIALPADHYSEVL